MGSYKRENSETIQGTAAVLQVRINAGFDQGRNSGDGQKQKNLELM